MKATVVPAQVTTVEDRVAGSLSFSQLILLAVPVFGGSLLYAILPPSMGASTYKTILVCVIAAICALMAIRIKGKIVLLWLFVLLRYALRPKYYLFNKNTQSFRKDYPEPPVENVSTRTTADGEKLAIKSPKLGLLETSRVYATMDDPTRKLRFEMTKKGALHVRLTEVEEQI